MCVLQCSIFSGAYFWLASFYLPYNQFQISSSIQDSKHKMQFFKEEDKIKDK